MTDATKPVCPKCGSSLTVEFSNVRRCQQCGHQFDLERDPVGRRARAERSEKTGWKRPETPTN